MALPAQGLSGLLPKLQHQFQYKNVELSAQAASVQAGQRERERVLHVVRSSIFDLQALVLRTASCIHPHRAPHFSHYQQYLNYVVNSLGGFTPAWKSQ